MKHVMMTSTFCVTLFLASTGATLAANTHTGGSTGQPSQHCGNMNALSSPGNASGAPGSVFNSGGVAGLHYAGNPDTHSLISNNPKAVSQYDVACFQVSQPH
jgi:hypothetical protein